jgi:hypothetical protein
MLSLKPALEKKSDDDDRSHSIEKPRECNINRRKKQTYIAGQHV